VTTRRHLRDEDLDAVISAVLRATQAFVGLALRSLSAAGCSITLPQYRMLVTLDGKGDQNVRDLAAGLGVDRSTATRMCNRLVNAGLIVRSTDPSDRRAVVISLTEPGRDVVKKVTQARREKVARLLRSVPPPRREQLVDLLGEFAELAERDPV
jgi:DNA-binding MarR family transcriptional regulator